MDIYLLFDYDDRVIRASCDGKKLREEANAMNGEDCFGPYYVIEFELEDMPTFEEEELNRIYQDQVDALNNVHIGDPCEKIFECPLDHFDRIDPYEYQERQNIITQILEKSNGE